MDYVRGFAGDLKPDDVGLDPLREASRARAVQTVVVIDVAAFGMDWIEQMCHEVPSRW